MYLPWTAEEKAMNDYEEKSFSIPSSAVYRENFTAELHEAWFEYMEKYDDESSFDEDGWVR